MGDRRLSAGGVLGLDAPAATPNLRTAQAMGVAEAAAATLDAYNAEGHGGDVNTIDEKVGDPIAEAMTVLAAPSVRPVMRRASAALHADTAGLLDSGVKGEGAEATKPKKKKKKKKKKANQKQ